MKIICILDYCKTKAYLIGVIPSMGLLLIFVSQGLLGLCCSIETRDRIEIITITAVLFE